MTELAPKHGLTTDETRGEMYFNLSGFFELEDIDDFLSEVNRQGAPLAGPDKTVPILGDFEGFVAQSQEVAERLRNHLLAAKDVGLKRIAIINVTPLAKMQYKRLSQSLDVEFFDNKQDALEWMRRPY